MPQLKPQLKSCRASTATAACDRQMLAATTLPGNAGKAGTALVLPPCLQQDAPAPGHSWEAGLAAPAVFSKTEPSGSCSRSLGLVGTKRGGSFRV